MIKFFASIPKSYIKSVPPGRYLINAAQFWEPSIVCDDFGLPSLPRDGYTWMIDSGGYQFRDGYPKGYIDKYVQFIQDLQPDFAVFPDAMGDAGKTLELFEYTDKLVPVESGTVWLPVIQGEKIDEFWDLVRNYRKSGYCDYAIGGLKDKDHFEPINYLLNSLTNYNYYNLPEKNVMIHFLGAGLRILKKLDYTGRDSYSCDSGNFNQRFGKNIQKCNDYMRLNDCTQKQAVIECMLPDYKRKVEEL